MGYGMLLWLAGILAFVAIGLMVYGEWTENRGARVLSYVIAGLVVVLGAISIRNSVINGRAKDEDAGQTTLWAWCILAVLLAVLLIFGKCA